MNIEKSTALIPVFAGVIGGVACQVCDARTLHEFLLVGKDFSNWIKGRIKKYGFVEGEDFVISCSPNLASRNNQGLSNLIAGENRLDYHMTINAAKELAMVENNEQGKQARRYFIECERRANAQELNAQNNLPKDVRKACEFMAFRTANEYQQSTMNLIGSASQNGDDGVVWLVAFLVQKRLYDRLATLATEQLARKSTDEVTDWIMTWKPTQADSFGMRQVSSTTH
ncbi:MAG: antA/AntB antirepressor family protein [Gallionella sp.]